MPGASVSDHGVLPQSRQPQKGGWDKVSPVTMGDWSRSRRQLASQNPGRHEQRRDRVRIERWPPALATERPASQPPARAESRVGARSAAAGQRHLEASATAALVRGSREGIAA